VPRSVDSAANLAAALAKARGELINPKKRLTAAIRSDAPARQWPRPRAQGVARARLGTLSPILAHARGEWIMSDWLVCPAAVPADPRRRGAAPTCTRRCALFAPISIAGHRNLRTNATPAIGTTGEAASRRAICPIYALADVQGSPNTGKVDSGHRRGNVLALIALSWADPKGSCSRASQLNVAK
jgi:hypothetical protein